MEALNEKLPGGTVLSAITEEEGGKTLYEIKKKIGLQEYEVTITSEGIVESVEKVGANAAE